MFPSFFWKITFLQKKKKFFFEFFDKFYAKKVSCKFFVQCNHFELEMTENRKVFSTFSNFYLGNKASYEKCTQNIFCLKLIIDFEKIFFFGKKVIFFFKKFFSIFTVISSSKRLHCTKNLQETFFGWNWSKNSKKNFFWKKCFLFFAKKWFLKKRT